MTIIVVVVEQLLYCTLWQMNGLLSIPVLQGHELHRSQASSNVDIRSRATYEE